MAKYQKPKAANDHDEDDFQTSMDADTLARHSEIASDPDRHDKAMKHLAKKAKKAKDDHERTKKLHQHVKKGLNKAFGGGGGFQEEKDKETAEAEKIVNEKE